MSHSIVEVLLEIMILHYLFTRLVTFIGNVYIADTSNNRIRKVTVSTGIITTFVGTGTGSFSGDGGAATSGTVYFPIGVAVDSAGITLSRVSVFI